MKDPGESSVQTDETEDFVRRVLDNVVDGIVVIDDRGLIEAFNGSAEGIFGYTGDEIIGQNVAILTPPPIAAEHDGYISNYLKTGKAKILGVGPREVMGKHKDGSQIPLELAIGEMEYEGDRKFIGALRDVTERRQLERTLFLRSRALEASSSGIIITDASEPDNPIIYSNPAFTRITGYAAEEAAGRNCRFLQADDRDQGDIGRLRAAIRDGQSLTVVLRNYRKDGTMFLNELAIAPVLDGAGGVTHFIGVQTDITERRQTEEQLFQAQKMEATGQLTGGVAHDFNNLLTVILGNLQMLSRSLNDERNLERLETALRAVKRGSELTKRLLAFSRQQVLTPQVLRINDLIGEMENLLRLTMGENVDVVLELASDVLRVNVDAAQLESALLNMALNARDAMPLGGRLVIETSNRTFDEKYAAQHTGVRAGEHVMLSISDTGTGISSEDIEKIFEPFFTTKDVGAGSGLGLSMVYGFVKQSGGNVTVYSEEGQGTCVKIYFPAAEGMESAVRAAGLAEDTLSLGDETILVVEDDEDVRKTAASLLGDLGYKVLQAVNGVDALAVLDQHKDIDLLFTDVVMPGGMNGAELGRKVLDLLPDTLIVYTSGYTENTIVHGGVLDEGTEWLGKPYSNEELAQKIRQTLDTNRERGTGVK